MAQTPLVRFCCRFVAQLDVQQDLLYRIFTTDAQQETLALASMARDDSPASSTADNAR